ncbi:6-carboxytetrahydropterin synthase, partial [Collinsella sp. Sow4_E3]
QTIPTNQLHTHHKNPRRGDVQATADSLRVNGQFRPIVVNRGTHTGRPMEVLAGNHTLMAARDLAEEGVSDFAELDCYVVDVDEDQATRIVLADNRTADIGSYDNEELLALLETLGDELDDVGFVLDYRALAGFGAWLDEKFDHQHLNDRVGFNPTAENMTRLLYETARNMGLPAIAVSWSETPKT